MDMPFFPGRKPDPPEPLAIFLPPYFEGTGTEFLRRLGKPKARIVDPFGQSPALALELARGGAAVLLASPNPVLRAILALQADPPSPQLIRDTLARLARSPSSLSPTHTAATPENLEEHIRSLYRGTCAFCGRDSEADGFVWEYETESKTHTPAGQPPARELFKESNKGKPKPRLIRRICSCPYCNHTIEEPASSGEDKGMPTEASRQMLYHYALERIAPLDDPTRINAADALDAYPSRSLYAIILILRRLETMGCEPEEKRCVDLLLLSVLDRAHILRGHGHHSRTRPRSLQPPAEFLEGNIWRALERAVEEWSLPARTVPLRKWREGESLEPGAIHTFAGTARELAPHLAELKPDGVISFLPRPNQAAWTLAAVWAEWLWGRAVSAPMAGTLQRRWFDWNWHARALTASASALAAHLPSGTPMAATLGEWDPPFFAASLWAFHQAGFTLSGRAVRTDPCTAQLLWSAPGPEHPPLPHGPHNLEAAGEVARLAVRRMISSRAEPVPWDLLHAAAWSEVVHRRMLPPDSGQPDDSEFLRSQEFLAKTIRSDPEIQTTEKKGESEYGVTWWLPGDESITSPLSDQVETEVARMLLEDGPIRTEELDRRICSFFPGLLTPDQRLLQACLESYGMPAEGERGWILRPEDQPDSRTEELKAMRGSLAGLGARMGFFVEDEREMYWTDTSGRKYCFVFTGSAAVGRYMLQPVFDLDRSWLVLPGGRAVLVGFKLKGNVLLRRAVADGWRFLKFRHIRRLLEDPYLRPENLEERMGLDPLEVTEDKVPLL